MEDITFPKEVPIIGRVKICLDLVREQNIKGKVVIDVGSSFGWLEKEIRSWGAKEIFGIDPNERAIAFAGKNAPNAKFVKGTADNIPLPNSYADIITLFDVIEHVPRKSELKVLKEAGRVLKKGGILLFSTPNANFWSNLSDVAWYFGHRHYTERQIYKFMDGGGFRVEKIMKKGNFINPIYTLWFYIAKRIFGIIQPRNRFFEKIDDACYRKDGIITIFLVAVKK